MIGRSYHAIGSRFAHDDREAIRPCSCGKPRMKSFHLACPECWALVPQALQTKVYRLYKSAQGSDAHRAAVRDCYEEIRRGRELAKGAAATEEVQSTNEAPHPWARKFSPGDRVQWMHEKSSGTRINLSQRSGVVLEVHGSAVILRDDVSKKKTKVAARRLRFATEKGHVTEFFEGLARAVTESEDSKGSPSPES